MEFYIGLAVGLFAGVLGSIGFALWGIARRQQRVYDEGYAAGLRSASFPHQVAMGLCYTVPSLFGSRVLRNAGSKSSDEGSAVAAPEKGVVATTKGAKP